MHNIVIKLMHLSNLALKRWAFWRLMLAVSMLHLLALQAVSRSLGAETHNIAFEPVVWSTRTISLPSPEPALEPQASLLTQPQRLSTAPTAPVPPANPENLEKKVISEEKSPQDAAENVAGEVVAREALKMPAAILASAEPSPGPSSPMEFSPVKLPPSVEMAYEVRGQAKGLNYFANSQLSWSWSAHQYQASLTVKAFLLGSRVVTSRGAITVKGLSPLRYAEKSRSEMAAHFEAEKGLITFSANTPDAQWQPGAQDRLGIFFQLAGLLAGQEAQSVIGKKIPIYTAGPREVDTWLFVVSAEEKLELPLKTLLTLKLTREPRKEFDKKIEVWFAPSMNYLPVRIKITESSGDFIDQQLKEINVSTKAAS